MTLMRSLLFNLWFYGITLVLASFTLLPRLWHALRRRGSEQPSPPPSWPMPVARLWARLVLGALRPLCGITWEVSGREHLPASGPALIASMHQSAFDTMVWLLLVPDTCYVLKRELQRIPLFGPITRDAGMISVDRGAGAAAIRSLLTGADDALARGRQIVIFPEGTRATPGAPLVLHPGIAALAARTGLPVIPVATDSGHCWGRRAFRKHPGRIHIAIAPPLPARLRRGELMARLERSFAEGSAALAGGAVDNSVG
ncbi:MAG: 1-acyl-sn-glycerol-3-phosphate acyltransferase [Rhodospirillales bacterium]|nr:1-acyl-sn-glycerol-3-phosphate acyltransferase [Rhodospirillales bacterium]